MTDADTTARELCTSWLGGDTSAGPPLSDRIEETAAWESTPYGWRYDPGLDVITGWVGTGPFGYYWQLNLWGTPANGEPRGFAGTLAEAMEACLAALRRILRGD